MTSSTHPSYWEHGSPSEGLEDVWLVCFRVCLQKPPGGRASGLSVCLMDNPFFTILLRRVNEYYDCFVYLLENIFCFSYSMFWWMQYLLLREMWRIVLGNCNRCWRKLTGLDGRLIAVAVNLVRWFLTWPKPFFFHLLVAIVSDGPSLWCSR